MSGRYPWWVRPAAVVAWAAVMTLGATWRVRRIGPDPRRTGRPGSGGCIFAVWHAQQLSLAYTHRHGAIAVLSSHHRDGELMSRVLVRLGFISARGSSTRGAEGGLREMLRYARRGHSLAMTPDGPRGPAERVKPGTVYLASRTGLPVVPVGGAATRAWRLRSWDRFTVPRPFSRVVVAYGDPILVPAAIEDSEMEIWRDRIEASIREANLRADAGAEARG